MSKKRFNKNKFLKHLQNLASHFCDTKVFRKDWGILRGKLADYNPKKNEIRISFAKTQRNINELIKKGLHAEKEREGLFVYMCIKNLLHEVHHCDVIPKMLKKLEQISVPIDLEVKSDETDISDKNIKNELDKSAEEWAIWTFNELDESGQLWQWMTIKK